MGSNQAGLRSRPRSLGRVECQGRRPPRRDQLITDISTIIRERFWEEQYGAVAEEFTHEWGCSKQQAIQRVHMPERIAKLIIGGHATADGWRVPEHFMKKWLQIGLMQAVQCFGPVARHWGTR